jgi:hypothetical protein
VTVTGRRLRVAVTVIVFGLLVIGSFVGTDHDFPFGPFRMYSTSGRSTGAVRTAALKGWWHDREIEIHSEKIGIRRAELEGQYPRFRRDPRMLAALARSFRAEGVRLDRLQLIVVIRRVVNGRRVGRSTHEVLAEWKAPR